jgi:hypothetical protein
VRGLGQFNFQVGKLLDRVRALHPYSSRLQWRTDSDEKASAGTLLDFEPGVQPAETVVSRTAPMIGSKEQQEDDAADPDQADSQRNGGNGQEREGDSAFEFVVYVVHARDLLAFRFNQSLSLSCAGFELQARSGWTRRAALCNL